MTRTSITANMTATELAAWKANNRKQAHCGTIIIEAAKPARKSQRQEWQDFRAETIGMIEAAKRERHFRILPQLMQRLTTANKMLSNCATN